MNLLTLLQSDFRALSVESKKKFPLIKEVHLSLGSSLHFFLKNPIFNDLYIM